MDKERFFEVLEEILSYDPGQRGLLKGLTGQDIKGAYRLLEGSERLMIVTGFPILAAGVGENDGPVGAAALALAAIKTGRKADIVTDRLSYGLVRACLAAVGAEDCCVHCLEIEGDPGQAAALATEIKPDLVVAVERPGKGRDRHFHNMRGQLIDHLTADTDGLLGLGVPSIGVGDGGNELGMGNFAGLITQNVPCGESIAATACSTVPLVAGVSNWWGWGMAALLGAAEGIDCMTTAGQEYKALKMIAQAGGVDGVKGRCGMSVDGVELGGIIEIHGRIKAALGVFLAGGQC